MSSKKYEAEQESRRQHLPTGKSVTDKGNPGDDCPRCSQAEMEPFGGKLRCPSCFYLQPCCDPA